MTSIQMFKIATSFTKVNNSKSTFLMTIRFTTVLRHYICRRYTFTAHILSMFLQPIMG